MKKANVSDADSKKELCYKKLTELLRAMGCMTATHAKVEMYLNMEKEFFELTGYKDAEEYALKCRRLAEMVNGELIKTRYEAAKNIKDKAKNAKDYGLAANEFRTVRGYLDADQMVVQCEQLSIQIEKKKIRHSLLNKLGILLCVFAAVFIITKPITKYNIANMFMRTNSYNSAMKIYDKLGKYKDSEKRKVEANRLLIRNSEAGDIVEIGNCKWIVLDIENEQVLLLRKDALEARAYHDTTKEVTWEKSALRQYLNSDFLSETFSENESKNIILSNIKTSRNEKYGTHGGNDTQDSVFLLSIDEAEKYKSLFQGFKGNSWLRTPGYTQSCAAFLSGNRFIMDYGYTVTCEDIAVHPAFWLDIKE